jgi:hypothetical protein
VNARGLRVAVAAAAVGDAAADGYHDRQGVREQRQVTACVGLMPAKESAGGLRPGRFAELHWRQPPAIPSPSEIAGSSHPSMLLLREGR